MTRYNKANEANAIREQMVTFEEKINSMLLDFQQRIEKQEEKCIVKEDLPSNDALLTDLQDLKKHIFLELSQMKTSIESRLTLIERSQDAQEQYSRRNCLVLHGVPETSNENTDNITKDVLHNNLGLVSFEITHTERTHRLGRPRQPSRQGQVNTPRPIIIKFTSYRYREEAWRSKVKLRGSGMRLTESLTKTRLDLLHKAREKVGPYRVWTQDGRILAENSGKTYRVNTEEDLKSFTQQSVMK